MLDEPEYRIHMLADNQWQVEFWLNHVLIASKVVSSQSDIDSACDEMRTIYEQVQDNHYYIMSK